MEVETLKEAGLTDGEAKVYLALLKLGPITSGPVIEESGVANSIIYRILNNLIDKGLASYIIKGKTKYFRAAKPQKILDYIDEKKDKLEKSKIIIEKMIPQLLNIHQNTQEINAQIFEGFKGFITAWEICYSKLGKGEEYHSWGVYPQQEERFHIYWEKDHQRRKKAGFKAKILFNKDTDKKILQNRNSFWGCDSRYMPLDIKTPAWFVVYKDITNISLQTRKFEEDGSIITKPLSIVIENKEIAETFEAYFQDLWKRTKRLSK